MRQVAKLIGGVRPAELDAAVRELNADYAARRCPYFIESQGAGYRLRLRDEYSRLAINSTARRGRRGSRWPPWRSSR